MASATELEEIRKRHDEVETNYGDEPWDENCIEDGEAAHKDRATLITHIAALEAELARLSGAATPAPTAALTEEPRLGKIRGEVKWVGVPKGAEE